MEVVVSVDEACFHDDVPAGREEVCSVRGPLTAFVITKDDDTIYVSLETGPNNLFYIMCGRAFQVRVEETLVGLEGLAKNLSGQNLQRLSVVLRATLEAIPHEAPDNHICDDGCYLR